MLVKKPRGSVLLPAVSKAATSSPVQLEDAVGVGHRGAVQGQGLGSSGGGSEVDKAVSGVAPTIIIRIIKGSVALTVGEESKVLPRELVTDHLDVDLLTHLEPKVADEVLIDPGLELTHPFFFKLANTTLHHMLTGTAPVSLLRTSTKRGMDHGKPTRGWSCHQHPAEDRRRR